MERRNNGGHVKRDLIVLGCMTFLASLVAVKAVDRGGDCTGLSEFHGKHKLISACLTEDGQITVGLPYGDKRLLPAGICRLTQIWGSYNSDKQIIYFRYLSDGYEFEINSFNVETGEFGIPTVYFIPQELTRGMRKNKTLLCEK